jgi:hypothetical protein
VINQGRVAGPSGDGVVLSDGGLVDNRGTITANASGVRIEDIRFKGGGSRREVTLATASS